MWEWWRTLEEGGRAGPSFWRGGVVSLGLGWERETRGPKRQDQGTRTAGGNRYATRNNLGEIEVEVELELGRVQKKKKKGPRPLEQGADVRVRTGRLLRYLACLPIFSTYNYRAVEYGGVGLGAAAEKQFLVLLPTHTSHCSFVNAALTAWHRISQ